MNNLNILIVEDEKPTAEKIKKLIGEIDESIHIVDHITTVRETRELLKKDEKIDLILLDIQLADGIAFEIFENSKVETPVIFITAYDKYAIKAFELNSIDYLLKPINKEKLESALEKFKSVKDFYSNSKIDINEVLKVISTKEYKKRFVLNVGRKIVPVEINNIAYFYALEGDIYLKTFDNKSYNIDYSLEYLESIVDPDIFFRISRQFLINIESIKNIISFSNYQLKLDLDPDSKDDVFVSKKKTLSFKNWLNK